MRAVFVEFPAFARHRDRYLDDDSFRVLQELLMQVPELGALIQGTGGLRKLRVGPSSGCLMQELARERDGKVTLRRHVVQMHPVPDVSGREILKLRQELNMSRGVFAAYLRTNVRTLENWEQGRARPNAQAALLIRLVQRFPDTIGRLAEI